MINKTLFILTLTTIISVSYCDGSLYQIKNLKLNELYNEKTLGNVMNLYSAAIDSNLPKNSDLKVDAILENKVGIFDSPLVLISTVIFIYFIRIILFIYISS